MTEYIASLMSLGEQELIVDGTRNEGLKDGLENATEGVRET